MKDRPVGCPAGRNTGADERQEVGARTPPSMSPRLLLSVVSYAVTDVNVMSPPKLKSSLSEPPMPLALLRVVVAFVVGDALRL